MYQQSIKRINQIRPSMKMPTNWSGLASLLRLLQALPLARVQGRLSEPYRCRRHLQHLVLPHVGNQLLGAHEHGRGDLDRLVG